MMTFSMTLTDPLRSFQGHGIFEVEYLKNGASLGQSYYKTLIGYYNQSIGWYTFSDLDWI